MPVCRPPRSSTQAAHARGRAPGRISSRATWGLSLTCRAARPLRGAAETCPSCCPRLLATEARPAQGAGRGSAPGVASRVGPGRLPAPAPRALPMPGAYNCPRPAPGRLACRLGPLRECRLHSCPPSLLGLSEQAAAGRGQGFRRSGRSSPRGPPLHPPPPPPPQRDQRERQPRLRLPATSPVACKWSSQCAAPRADSEPAASQRSSPAAVPP